MKRKNFPGHKNERRVVALANLRSTLKMHKRNPVIWPDDDPRHLQSLREEETLVARISA